MILILNRESGVFLFDVCRLDIISETFSLDLANANSVALFVYLSLFTT